MTRPLLYETHMHTPLCNHARGTPEEYAQTALEKGLDGIIVTCHSPLPYGWVPRPRMTPEQYPQYVDMVNRAKDHMRDTMDVRLGLEMDYIPGLEWWIEDLLQKEPLEYVLGSVHLHEAYLNAFSPNDWPTMHRQYFSSLADAAETGYFDCLAHPDLIQNYGMDLYNLSDLMDDVRRSLDRIAHTGVAMELNTSGKQKRGKQMNPAPEILMEICKRDIPVILGADAHSPERVAGDFLEAIDLLERTGFTHLHLCLEKTLSSISLDEARKKLQTQTVS